ncbi:helix-turn-helix transcriptional regulator [Caulobacter sp. CCG-8]|uniref:helix-turn-helix domain-containing protein n=1 Tax=Caulobacter sp. CCG-8 TaxID=3127958 RepID=UPI00307EEFB1
MSTNRIRHLREAAHLTLDALADMAGTTNQQISHLEMGKRRLTVGWMEKLAKALDCHPWALVSADPIVSTTPREQQLLNYFRGLSGTRQEALLAEIKPPSLISRAD